MSVVVLASRSSLAYSRRSVVISPPSQGRHALPLRQSLETRQAFRNLMKRLLVDGENRHLRGAEQGGIVERADFQVYRRQTRPSRHHMGAALGAEFPRHRVLEIAARELLRLSLGIAKTIGRHQHEHVRRAAADILAFAAMALRFE